MVQTKEGQGELTMEPVDDCMPRIATGSKGAGMEAVEEVVESFATSPVLPSSATLTRLRNLLLEEDPAGEEVLCRVIAWTGVEEEEEEEEVME